MHLGKDRVHLETMIKYLSNILVKSAPQMTSTIHILRREVGRAFVLDYSTTAQLTPHQVTWGNNTTGGTFKVIVDSYSNVYLYNDATYLTYASFT